MLELLNWVADRPRTIGEIMVAWPTWEDARRNGLVTLAGDDESNAGRVSLSPLGRAARDRRPITVSILDDFFDTLHTLPCFAKLAPFDVTIWNDHVEDVDVLAERLKNSEVLVLIRERTKIQAPLVAGLPKLRLISQRSVYPHIDINACTQKGVIVSSNQHGTRRPCRRGVDRALVLAAVRQIPEQVGALRRGGLANRRRRDVARKDPRHLRLRTDR